MNNKFLRLFVTQSKLMTAEKMKLDRFLREGEFFSYRVMVDANNVTPSMNFLMEVDVDKTNYKFDADSINDKSYAIFEQHLSDFLNVLFERKLEFEHKNQLIDTIVTKLNERLTDEEKQCLISNIDANTDSLLRRLAN